jgi:hypothetical protein
MIHIARQLAGTGLQDRLPVFGSEEFLSCKSPDYGWFVSDEFALPFFVDQRFRKIGFYRLVLTTEPIALQNESTPEAESVFLNDAVRLCKEQQGIKADSIATQANAVFRAVPAAADSLPWGSYIVDLTKTETEIFEAFDAKHRNMIRRAAKGGVTVTSSADVFVIFENLKETMTRQKLLFFPSLSYLTELQSKLRDKITFYLAMHEGKLQGTAVVVHNNCGGFYYYGGSIAEPYPGSLAFMQYEIMKHLKAGGAPVYDLMGARIAGENNEKIENIQRFKRRFSSGMRSGFCFRQILSPMKHKVVTAAVKTYFKLKGSHYDGDVIDQSRRDEPKATS